MRQQNTTEKDPAQNRYNNADQENRPRRKRRRRHPAADPAPLEPETEKTVQAVTQRESQDPPLQDEISRPSRPQAEPVQNVAAPTAEAQNENPKGGAVSHTVSEAAPAAEALQNTAPQDEAIQNTTPQDETSREPATQTVEVPATEPETAVAENMDYQAAYQEIYRDILNNLRSFSPSDQVACSITEEHISEYLNNSHAEKVMQFKERREKRFFTALELIAVLAAVVLLIHYLQNNSAILVNILYIIAGLGALFLWKFQPKNDDKPDSSSGEEDR